MSSPDRLFTIGHGSRSLSEFLASLTANRVRMVLDVRSQPHSARFPHFSRHALEASLGAEGISYRWLGRTLGGRRLANAAAAPVDDPVMLAAGVATVLRLNAAGTCALLCAEISATHCHRRRLADALTEAGAEVVHIGPDGSWEPHQPQLDL